MHWHSARRPALATNPPTHSNQVVLISQQVPASYGAVVPGRHVHPSVGDIRPHSSAFCRSLWPRRSTDSLGPLWASRFRRLRSSDLEQSAGWCAWHVSLLTLYCIVLSWRGHVTPKFLTAWAQFTGAPCPSYNVLASASPPPLSLSLSLSLSACVCLRCLCVLWCWHCSLMRWSLDTTLGHSNDSACLLWSFYDFGTT